MSGRGRGRGRGSGFTFNTDGLGLARSDILEISKAPRHLSSLYPPLQFKALPIPEDKDIEETEEIAYMLSQKKFNYIVKPVKEAHNDVERYSDRYYRDDTINEKYDYSRMPVELRPVSRKRKLKQTPVIGAGVDVKKTLEELEALENVVENEQSDEEKEEAEEEGVVIEEEYEEEEQEEGTDYNSNYFDNGEGYLDEEEDNLDDDGPIYS